MTREQVAVSLPALHLAEPSSQWALLVRQVCEYRRRSTHLSCESRARLSKVRCRWCSRRDGCEVLKLGKERSLERAHTLRRLLQTTVPNLACRTAPAGARLCLDAT